jgi:hypothetical protein
LTSSPTRSSGSPRLQIDVQDGYQIRFGRSTYARKEKEIKFLMAVAPGQTKIILDKNCQNNFNIQSPTRRGAVHIKTDAQVAYNIQLGHSLLPLKGKEITLSMELVPCLKSSGIIGNHQNHLTSRIYLSVAAPFLAFGLCIVSSPLGLHPGVTCTSLYPL